MKREMVGVEGEVWGCLLTLRIPVALFWGNYQNNGVMDTPQELVFRPYPAIPRRGGHQGEGEQAGAKQL